ncbi:hypothetical protein V8G54_003485 [Vigna mungo]|uniref:GAG-pre-integrase domain-containing protein n=1 Tax=Vigna mungo TaxID=3915 RepID=A0AAQ3PA48_VIGMU
MHKNSEHKALLTSADNLSWIVDSGASDHMTGNSSPFSTLNSCNSSATVTIAAGSKSPIKGVGNVKLSEKLTLTQVFYIPDLKCNLMSKLNKDLKCLTVFESDLCLFQERESGTMIECAKLINGLYHFSANKPSHHPHPRESISPFYPCIFSSNKIGDVMLLHHRLGHQNFGYLKHLFPNLFINKKVDDFFCEVCQLWKHTCASYIPLPYVASKPFQKIQCDIWGASEVSSINGARWFLLLVDYHTRLCWVYLMKTKSETISIIKQFHSMVITQFLSLR